MYITNHYNGHTLHIKDTDVTNQNRMRIRFLANKINKMMVII